MSDLEEKMREELSVAAWETLRPHAERGSLICVSEGLDLVDAAVAVAGDQAEKVNEWITKGLFQKPTEETLEAWNQEPGKYFQFLIVQPFVLVVEYSLDSQQVH
jgi:hypothetical protein